MNTQTNTPIVWRKGKKTILRPLIETDLQQFQTWINDPVNTQYLLLHWPIHEVGQRHWFQTVQASDPDNITIAVCTHDGTLIGNMSLKINPRAQTATTGSLIGDAQYRNQGYGTDAKMLLLEYAFNWRNLRKVTSNIIAFNDRSQKYAQNCGYRHMATIEQEYFRHGKWYDEYRFVVFRDEWLPFWERYTTDWTPDW